MDFRARPINFIHPTHHHRHPSPHSRILYPTPVQKKKKKNLHSFFYLVAVWESCLSPPLSSPLLPCAVDRVLGSDTLMHRAEQLKPITQATHSDVAAILKPQPVPRPRSDHTAGISELYLITRTRADNAGLKYLCFFLCAQWCSTHPRSKCNLCKCFILMQKVVRFENNSVTPLCLWIRIVLRIYGTHWLSTVCFRCDKRTFYWTLCFSHLWVHRGFYNSLSVCLESHSFLWDKL